MIDCPINLRHTATPVHECKAYYIPVASVDSCLDALLRIATEPENVEIYPIPKSREDRTLTAYLITSTKGIRLPHLNQFHEYTLVADKLFLPTNAELLPKMQSSELAEHFPLYRYVFHPSIGAIGFEAYDILSPFELISTPKARTSGSWDKASEGKFLASSVSKITAIELPSFSIIFEQEKKIIGTEDIKDTPTPNGEKPSKLKDSLSTLSDQIKALGLRAIAKLTRLVPSIAGTEETWVNRLENWAGKNLSDLHDKRNKEINRLIELLKSNPEEGLRYALPLLKTNRNRGTAVPGASLGRRSTTFDLRRSTAGGGASDSWDVSHRTQQELRRQYVEAANNAIAQGHYSRAAYIFAELLEDFRSAANTLRQGKMYHEAAALYDKQLHSKKMAADCLIEGGLFHEAVPFLVQLKHYEPLGDLYLKIGDNENAEIQFLTAIENTSSPLEKARIHKDKRSDTDTALSLLNSSWPHGKFAPQSQLAQLKLLGELERHKDTQSLLHSIASGKRQLSDTPIQIKNLAQVHKEYPNLQTQESARVSALAIFGSKQQSQQLTREESQTCLLTLRSFVPEDRLWQRDLDRFRNNLPPKRLATKPVPKNEIQKIKPTCALNLDNTVSWSSLFEFKQSGYLALGLSKSHKQFRCAIGSWKSNAVHTFNWEETSTFSSAPAQHSRHSSQKEASIYVPHSDISLNPQAAQMSAYSPNDFSLGTPSWYPSFVVCVADSDADDPIILEGEQDFLKIGLYSTDGKLNHILNSDQEIQFDPTTTAAFHRRQHLYFASRGILHVFKNGAYSHIDLGEPFTIAACSTPRRKTRLALLYENHISLVWPEESFKTQSVTSISPHDNPVLGFTSAGLLIVATTSTGFVFSTNERPRLLARFQSFDTNNKPVGVVEGASGTEFRLLYQNGRLETFKIQNSN